MPKKIKELKFNPDNHEYTYGSVRVPSVTQTIGLVYGPRNIPEYYLQRGSEVHAIINSYLKKTLIEASVDEGLGGYLDALKSFFRWTGPAYCISERSFYSKRGYAGTVDLEVTDRKWIVDFKTGEPDQARDSMQLIAYRDGLPGHDLYNVYLSPDGKFKVIKRPWDKVIYNIFLAGVSILNYTRRF